MGMNSTQAKQRNNFCLSLDVHFVNKQLQMKDTVANFRNIYLLKNSGLTNQWGCMLAPCI